MFIPSKWRCLPPDPEIPCDRPRTMSDNSNLGAITTTACSGGRSRTGSRYLRAKTDSLCSNELECW